MKIKALFRMYICISCTLHHNYAKYQKLIIKYIVIL